MEKQYQLPKEFAEKWLTALHSGNYRQEHYKLYNRQGYCCLGVACKVADIENTLIRNSPTIPNDNRFNAIPEILRGNATPSNDLIYKLTNMNDSGKSFNEIANWIEENIEFV